MLEINRELQYLKAFSMTVMESKNRYHIVKVRKSCNKCHTVPSVFVFNVECNYMVTTHTLVRVVTIYKL